MPTTDRLKSALSDRYSIEREIGAGGMATVYLARDLKHDREVALKVLRADLSAVIGTDRFLSEVKIAAKLDHPHILTLIDSGEADGLLYYVLPYVRGESLRAKLERERQLGLEEAVSITTQVASALDYAHAQGVVHRDIKPENILLHHGEAVLADFGIALAVKEAGGNRLTETGLSLGTPQYMSPEQATGDRLLDKRSDIYSLGAVFYELIAGEPPVTGATAQAMIAKLLTERPVRLRVVRNTISESMERATEKALAKVPADRFASAGDFARALAVTAPERSTSKRNPRTIAIAAGAALLAIAALWFGISRMRTERPVALLKDRTQLTFTGRVANPTVSSDGKSIAYVVTNCGARGCRYGIEMQDVGSTASRRLLDGATALYGVAISPDRRNILLLGTINAVYGSFLLSTLGGQPRYLAAGSAAFWAGGDSIYFHRGYNRANRQWILVSGIDGIVADSIEVKGNAFTLGNVIPIPGSRWAVAQVNDASGGEGLSVARNGDIVHGLKFPLQRGNFGGASRDAVWMTATSESSPLQNIVRVGFNGVTGKMDSKGDTVHSGTLTSFAVTEDGKSIVMDEGSTEYAIWSLTLDQAIKGEFTENGLLARSTTTIPFSLSRDGRFLVLSDPSGRVDSFGRAWVLKPVEGGAQISIAGRHLNITVTDSANLIATDRTANGVRMRWINFRTGRENSSFLLPDSTIGSVTNLADSGWIWIEPDAQSFKIHRAPKSAPVKAAIPSWYKSAYTLTTSKDGRYAAFVGWRAPSEDSVGIGMISTEDGKVTHLWAAPGEGAGVSWLYDGSILVQLQDTPESATLYKLTTTGAVTRLGSIPRPITSISISRDMRRAAITTRDHKGDAWMSRVELVGRR